jgi:hypothetical protein
MDQLYSPLVNELFEPQQFPDLRLMLGGPLIKPYDVAGWTMQMGVETDAMLLPITTAQRAMLRMIASAPRPEGTMDGHGGEYSMAHLASATFAVMNEVFAAGGKVALVPDSGCVLISGLDATVLRPIARKRGLNRSWVPNIDKGWTRWILNNYCFAPATLAMAISKQVI